MGLIAPRPTWCYGPWLPIPLAPAPLQCTAVHCVVCGRISLSPSHVWRRGLNCFISLCATHSCSLCSPCSPPSPLLQQTRPSVGHPPPSGSLVINSFKSFLHFPCLSFNCQPLDLFSTQVDFQNKSFETKSCWTILTDFSPYYQNYLHQDDDDDCDVQLVGWAGGPHVDDPSLARQATHGY